MKITKITKEYYEVEGEKVYFFEPLEKVISIKELQKIMDTAEEVVNKLKEGKYMSEEEIKKLAEKITDYGFNDEYGYYSDWLDGVFPIIKNGIDQILKQEKNRILNDIKARVESGRVDISFVEKIIKE